MLNLKENPVLKDFQNYVEEMEIERGFKNDDVLRKCLLISEEVGELCKAVRKKDKVMKTDQDSECNSAGSELADIIMVTCAIANRLGVDLEEEFRKKEEINKKRNWK